MICKPAAAMPIMAARIQRAVEPIILDDRGAVYSNNQRPRAPIASVKKAWHESFKTDEKE
jgi:hypothetical protein